VARAQSSGLQIATHCVGDAAVEAMVAAVELAQGGDGVVLRHRIEHCAVCPRDLRRRMAAAGMAAVMQPLFAPFAQAGLARPAGPADRADVCPQRELLRAGVVVAFSSDLPFTTDPNPWTGLAAAVTDTSAPLTRLQALQAYTGAGAWTSFEEGVKGTLEVGRLADFQVYERDPLASRPTIWKDHRPDLVAVAGSPVYTRRKR
jgi:predicted amidohydrolase YtcJ